MNQYNPVVNVERLRVNHQGRSSQGDTDDEEKGNGHESETEDIEEERVADDETEDEEEGEEEQQSNDPHNPQGIIKKTSTLSTYFTLSQMTCFKYGCFMQSSGSLKLPENSLLQLLILMWEQFQL